MGEQLPFNNGDMVPRDAAVSATPVRGEPSRELLEVLRRRSWTIAFVVLLLLAAAIAYVTTATPVYRSQARLYLELGGLAPVGGGAMNAQQSDAYLHTQRQLLQSRPIVEEAIRSAGPQAKTTLAGVRDPVRHLRENLEVEVGQRDQILTVTMESPHREEAIAIVQGVVDAYLKYRSQQTRMTAIEVHKVLDKERQRREADFDAKLEEMVRFQRAHGKLAFQTDKGNMIIARLAQLSEMLTVAQQKTMEAEASYESVARAMQDPETLRQLIDAQQSRAIATDTEYAGLQAELHRLHQAVAVLQQRQVLPRHAMMEGTGAAIQRLEEQIHEKQMRFARAHLMSLEHQRQIARQSEQQIRAALAEQRREALDLNSAMAEHDRLKSQLARNEKASEILDERIEELNVSGDMGALDVKVLEPAYADEQPVWPRPVRVLGLAGVLGLIAGAGLALIRDWRDSSFRSKEEIRATLGVPLLHVVPHIDGWRASERAQIARLDPSCDAAEACRAIRTAIQLGIKGTQPRTVLLASPESGDGKTTLVANLATVIAQAGYRTLLMDTDLRNPVLGSLLGLEEGPGLSDVLAGRSALQDAIHPGGADRLDILPCGPAPINPSELLNSREFGAILDHLAAQYDYVLLDSPPVMGVTDVRILAAMCDVTLLVLRVGKSDRRTADEACDALLNVGASVLGVVANDAPNSGRYGYFTSGSHRRPTGRPGEQRQGEQQSLARQDPLATPSRQRSNRPARGPGRE